MGGGAGGAGERELLFCETFSHNEIQQVCPNAVLRSVLQNAGTVGEF